MRKRKGAQVETQQQTKLETEWTCPWCPVTCHVVEEKERHIHAHLFTPSALASKGNKFKVILPWRRSCLKQVRVTNLVCTVPL